MEQARSSGRDRWNESPRLLAWAVRHGKVLLEEAAGWLGAESPEALLARATLLWPLLLGSGDSLGQREAALRESLRALTRDAAVVASQSTLAGWLRTLQAAGEVDETAWLLRRLLRQAGAWSRWRAWAPLLPAALVDDALASIAESALGPPLLSSLPEGEPEAFLRALAPAAFHPAIARRLLGCASVLTDEAGDRVTAALVPHLPAEVLAEVAKDVVRCFRERLCAAPPHTAPAELAASAVRSGSSAPCPALSLLALATRMPPEEGLSLAFDVLVDADEAGAARLAQISPFVPQALVDEAAKRQRRAQSPARPSALAALAARTSHPAVRQRLFHEAYHETRFRRDHGEAVRVIPLAAPFLPDDALQWAGALPASPEALSMLADLLLDRTQATTPPGGVLPGGTSGVTPPALSSDMAAKLFALALRLLAAVSSDDLGAQPSWTIAINRLAAAAPPSQAEQLVPLGSRLAPDARLPFWEALAPRLEPSLLVALLEDEGAWSKLGPARWWTSALVDLVPPELVSALSVVYS